MDVIHLLYLFLRTLGHQTGGQNMQKQKQLNGTHDFKNTYQIPLYNLISLLISEYPQERQNFIYCICASQSLSMTLSKISQQDYIFICIIVQMKVPTTVRQKSCSSFKSMKNVLITNSNLLPCSLSKLTQCFNMLNVYK